MKTQNITLIMGIIALVFGFTWFTLAFMEYSTQRNPKTPILDLPEEFYLAQPTDTLDAVRIDDTLHITFRIKK